MVDAYKCQSCGTVVERPQSCPSCGENGMQPTRVPESALDESDETAADDGTAAVSPNGTGDTDTGETEHGGSQRRGETRSEARNTGLLAWLKSLL